MLKQPYLINQLIYDLKNKTGLPGESFYQCKQITKLMAEKGQFISAHTLGRLLGVIQPPRKTYTSSLDVISRFLGYRNWQDFCNNCNTNYDTFINKNGESDEGHIHIAEIQHALHFSNYRKLGFALDKIIIDYPIQKWAARNEIGFYAKKNPKETSLFKFLGDHPVGRDVYYRTFVDEDDDQGYFSNYLNRYFLKNTQYEGDIIFATSFIKTKNAYAKAKNIAAFSGIENECRIQDFLGKDNHDYHIISRYVELFILEQKNKIKIHNIVDQVLQIESHFIPFNYAFVIGRMLRALYFKDFTSWAIQYKPLINACKRILTGLTENFETTEELFVQLHYYAAIMNDADRINIVPRKMKHTWLSTKENMILNQLTLSLLFPDQKSYLLKLSNDMQKQLNQHWAGPLIRHLQSKINKTNRFSK